MKTLECILLEIRRYNYAACREACEKRQDCKAFKVKSFCFLYKAKCTRLRDDPHAEYCEKVE